MTFEPVFLSISEILAIHYYQIVHHGGTDGLRSLDLLNSAVGMPASTFDGQYLHPSIPEMAASYLFHIVENHPFLDGNKRVGSHVAVTFLDLNGYSFNASNDEYSDLVLQVAKGEKTLSDVSLFFHRHSRPMRSTRQTGL